jgi:hypothetical protein
MGNSAICLAPEGADQPGGRLSWPPVGVGRFILLLARKGLRLIPVGCWEEAGSLFLRFGRAYGLDAPDNLTADERDRRIAQIVMRKIASLLPLHLRGDFA